MADKDKKASAKNKKEAQKVSFFQGVKREWGKIIWPTKEDLTRQTALVVIISDSAGRYHFGPDGRDHHGR